jgi:hypothetical protein
MYLGPALTNVGSVTVELQPKIFDLGVCKSLEDATVEFMAGGVGCTDLLEGRLRCTVKGDTYDG